MIQEANKYQGIQGWAFNHPIIGEDTSFDKFGAKAGYEMDTSGMHIAADVSMLNDARVLSSANNKGDMGTKSWVMADMKNAADFKKVAAYNGHVGIGYGQIHVDGNVLSFADNVAVAGGNSKPQILGLSASYDMNLAGRDSKLSVSYEQADDKGADVFFADKRMAADYSIALEKNLDLVLGVSQLDMKPVKLEDTLSKSETSGNIKIAKIGVEAHF